MLEGVNGKGRIFRQAISCENNFAEQIKRRKRRKHNDRGAESCEEQGAPQLQKKNYTSAKYGEKGEVGKRQNAYQQKLQPRFYLGRCLDRIGPAIDARVGFVRR